MKTARIVPLLSVLGLAGCGASALPAPAPVGVEVCRIDLGRELFEPGDAVFASGARVIIADRLAGLPAGSRVRVEAFSNPRHPHQFRDTTVSLSQARAETLAAYLKQQGFAVERSTGQGAVTLNGRKPDARCEIVVLE